MDTMTPTAQYLCMGCRVFISGEEQHMAHYTVCPSPNILCLGLVLKPAPNKGADEEKPEKTANPHHNSWPMINGGQVMNASQIMNIGQVMNAGQVVNSGQALNGDTVMSSNQLMSLGQMMNAGQMMNVPSGSKARKPRGAHIYGNQSVVINNYY